MQKPGSGELLAGRLPSVGVVVPTRDRPELVRAAVASVLEQDYAGPVETLVVYDGTSPDRDLERGGDRPVRCVRNDRTPGLCGSRNTGVLGLRTDLVAFLDDDDRWHPSKLRVQVERMLAEDAEFVTTGIAVDYEGTRSVRRIGTDRVPYEVVLRTRMAALHSSSFLVRRALLLDGIGLTPEDIPGGMCEDWDLLLRATRRRPLSHVDEPLVEVLWGRSSYFAEKWETKVDARRWMLEHHPDLGEDRAAAARVYSQLAFWTAGLGRRQEALGWAARALRRQPGEVRAYLALAVAARLVTARRVLDVLHRRGRGI